MYYLEPILSKHSQFVDYVSNSRILYHKMLVLRAVCTCQAVLLMRQVSLALSISRQYIEAKGYSGGPTKHNGIELSPYISRMIQVFSLFAVVLRVAAGSQWPPQVPANDDSSPWQRIPEKADVPPGGFYHPKLKGTHTGPDCLGKTHNYYLRESCTNPPQVYQARPYDIPFTMLNKGKLKFFKNDPKDPNRSQLNTNSPIESTNFQPGKNDDPKDSACGIPDNAYYPSKVAIHPYWLKFVPHNLGLGRMCMQDVCISVWNETHYSGGLNDIEVKVTDICSTDPSDPNYCETPADIMIDRLKAYQLYAATPRPAKSSERQAIKHGKEYPRPVYWFFSKCLQDGLPQEVYNTTDNWFSDPILPQNTKWSQETGQQQHDNNVTPYREKWNIIYKQGSYRSDDGNPPRFSYVWDYKQDWQPGDKTPDWCPVAGGKGHTKPPRGWNCANGQEQVRKVQ